MLYDWCRCEMLAIRAAKEETTACTVATLLDSQRSALSPLELSLCSFVLVALPKGVLVDAVVKLSRLGILEQINTALLPSHS